MKRVRLAAGAAAGLIPAAAGLAAAGHAPAAQASAAGAGGPAKTVSLHHPTGHPWVDLEGFTVRKIGGPVVYHRQYRPDISPGCDGKNVFYMSASPDPNLILSGWSAPTIKSWTCIGTIKPAIEWRKTLTKSFTVDVTSGNGRTLYKSQKSYAGKAGNVYIWSLGVHSAGHNDVRITLTSTYDSHKPNSVKVP